MSQEVPKELRILVRSVLDLLGQCIHQEYGKSCFKTVERVRTDYKKSRSSTLAAKVKLNNKLLKQFRQLSQEERFDVTHSFATSLELINACENAFVLIS
ncbi:MAG: phosphoenolpyruvate carboxylase [Bdellovibrionales bacterium]